MNETLIELPAQQEVYPQRIKAMWALRGRLEGQRCGTCKHFLRLRYSRVYFKCTLSRLSNSAATDWRARWVACGAWEGRDDRP